MDINFIGYLKTFFLIPRKMRTNGDMAYSRIYVQYFYTTGASKKLIITNTMQTNDEYENELIANGKSYVEKGGKLKIEK